MADSIFGTEFEILTEHYKHGNRIYRRKLPISSIGIR